jgi:hypothetical protein
LIACACPGAASKKANRHIRGVQKNFLQTPSRWVSKNAEFCVDFKNINLYWWQNAPKTSKSRIKLCFTTQGGLLCSESKSLNLIYSFWVHFVTNTSLYFWNLRKILRLLIPINPFNVKKSCLTHMYYMALKAYTCQEAASGPKTFLNIFCTLLQQNEPSPAWQWSWFQYQLALLYMRYLSGKKSYLFFDYFWPVLNYHIGRKTVAITINVEE